MNFSQPTNVVIADIDNLQFLPAPIRSGWIVGGDPRAEVAMIAKSADGTSSIMAWNCTQGLFHWHFSGDEVVHILAGELFISDRLGASERRIGPGDVVFFPAGSWQVWRVTQPLRKVAICRHAMPFWTGLGVRAWNRLKAAVAPDDKPPASVQQGSGVVRSLEAL